MGRLKDICKGKTIYIRCIDDKTYEVLWRMRRAYHARSWTDLIKRLAEEFESLEEEVFP